VAGADRGALVAAVAIDHSVKTNWVMPPHQAIPLPRYCPAAVTYTKMLRNTATRWHHESQCSCHPAARGHFNRSVLTGGRVVAVAAGLLACATCWKDSLQAAVDHPHDRYAIGDVVIIATPRWPSWRT